MCNYQSHFLKTHLSFSMLLLIGTIAGCAYGPRAHTRTQQVVREPGMYGTKGWNGGYASGQFPLMAADIDVNGEIGHPLTVYNPTANCVSPANTGWQFSSVNTASGTLPPGISANQSNGQLTGIPTERGHWIVTMSMNGITCNNLSYGTIAQIIRFHITGTGQVNQ